jgi:hypothetical protein
MVKKFRTFLGAVALSPRKGVLAAQGDTEPFRIERVRVGVKSRAQEQSNQTSSRTPPNTIKANTDRSDPISFDMVVV